MLNLAQYRPKLDRLCDHLPWVALMASGVILNKDGSFQRSYQYQGPDLDSATPEELVAVSARANNILRRLGAGWALFFEARRERALGYPQQGYETGIARLIDEERRAKFATHEGQHFETRYYLTLTWLVDADMTSSASEVLLERAEAKASPERDWKAERDRFIAQTEAVMGLFSSFMPMIKALDDAETLSFLHGAISTKKHPVKVPDNPIYLDAVLADTPLAGGLEPMLGDYHLRTLTLMGFPSHTQPGLLDGLNRLGLSYRWVSRFIPLDREQAVKTLIKLRRQWFSKRKSVTALLKEVLYNEASTLVDPDADVKVNEADEALQVLGAEQVGFGYLTTTITVMDKDAKTTDDKLAQCERLINGLGFTTKYETLNAVEAWLGSLPGHVYANVRQPLIHSLNLVHLMPLSAIWSGPDQNTHLKAPPLFYALSTGLSPFRFSTHVGDVGHMMILGPTGAGKSVILSFMALQFQRYRDAQVFIFDKGGSARAATLAQGGRHHRLSRQGKMAFQPLKSIDDPSERAWAMGWLCDILSFEKLEPTPDMKAHLWAALNALADAPVHERTLTGLSLLVASHDIKAALRPYTLEGAYGACLDADEGDIDLSRYECFETEELMHEQGLMMPILTYLFHRLEARFDGSPTLLILDEAWVFLDNPLFAGRIREWLKVLRKKNVSVIFATQSLSDVTQSLIAPVLLESCPQRIYLPNDRAGEPQAKAAYQALGLNDKQITLIAEAIPKRHYYLQSRRGNRLFELDIGPIAISVCASASPEDQHSMDEIVKAYPPEAFARQWLTSKGLDWAADLLNPYPST